MRDYSQKRFEAEMKAAGFVYHNVLGCWSYQNLRIDLGGGSRRDQLGYALRQKQKLEAQ